MQQSRLATCVGAALGAVSVLLLFAAAGYASDHQGKLAEEFHQVYPLSADGRIALLFDDRAGVRRLLKFDYATQNVEQLRLDLTHFSGTPWFKLSPDGRYCFFDRSGESEIAGLWHVETNRLHSTLPDASSDSCFAASKCPCSSSF